MALTKKEKKKYIDRMAMHCPYCDCNDLTIKSHTREADVLTVWHEVECYGCSKQWREIFTLTDIEEIENGKEGNQEAS